MRSTNLAFWCDSYHWVTGLAQNWTTKIRLPFFNRRGCGYFNRLIKIQRRCECAFRKLVASWLRTNDLSMRIRSCTEIENLTSSRISFFLFFQAQSREKFRAEFKVDVRYCIRPRFIRTKCACVSAGKAVENREINLDATYILHGLALRESAWKKSPGDADTAREALSLAVDISGGALFKGIPLLFKARRCKNMCHAGCA